MSLQLISTINSLEATARDLDRSAHNAVRLAKRSVAALPKWRLMRVLTYIETNIGGPITLANLAATAGLSRMYFAKQFRATTGFRPHEYVLRKRVERAQQLLATTSDALVDIALTVGFQTQAHFTTVFKNITGSTPYQWRREQPKIA
jgi:AraC-like DNA-binding protein